MRLGLGIFLGYVLIAALAGYFVLHFFVDEIKPSARQAMEDSLVDTANLLAELAADDVAENRLGSGSFARQVAAYQARQLNASIWGFSRNDPGFRLYITDSKGIVIYDSQQEALGRDFSRWNDVYLTLRGQYGVRSTPDAASPGAKGTTMHVAAPIKKAGELLGVLTIAKSNLAVEPFIERARSRMIQASYGLLAAALVIGILMSLWLSASVQKLVRFAEAVSRGERVVLPTLSLREMQKLGSALASMRERLEGKRYVEEYTMTLTHEMKSPLTAIRAAAELLEEPMPESQRAQFLLSIKEQARRLQLLIEKMLRQAALENRQVLDQPQRIDLAELSRQVFTQLGPRLEKKRISLTLLLPDTAPVMGEPFLLEQALYNLAENALDFSPAGGRLWLRLEQEGELWSLRLRDQGPGIPAYAASRVFERYYSLPRPDGSPKSTGLGLSFVQEVMSLHDGRAELSNHPEGGAEARLFLRVAG